MDVKSLLGTSSIVTADRTGHKTQATTKSNSMIDKILNIANDNINNTNNLLSDAENAEISFAMGETESTHDLMIAL